MVSQETALGLTITILVYKSSLQFGPSVIYKYNSSACASLCLLVLLLLLLLGLLFLLLLGLLLLLLPLVNFFPCSTSHAEKPELDIFLALPREAANYK